VAPPNPIQEAESVRMASFQADPPVQAEKAEMRAAAKARRAQAAKDAADAGKALSDEFCRSVRLRALTVVAGYLPIGDEINVRPLLRRLQGDGHRLALPRVVRSGGPLAFAAWTDGDPLGQGPFGTSQPTDEAAPVTPEVLIVPLLAFDRDGFRLGYGGGYYDRTLSALRTRRAILAVGVAFSAQEVPAVPHGAHDQRLDWVITEREAIKTEKGS
jgi:5-formyltetrahydrofolate cyclo-ligase